MLISSCIELSSVAFVNDDCFLHESCMCGKRYCCCFSLLQRPQVVAVQRGARLFSDESQEEIASGGKAAWRAGVDGGWVLRDDSGFGLANWVETNLVNESYEEVVDVVVQCRWHLDVFAAHCTTHPTRLCMHNANIIDFDVFEHITTYAVLQPQRTKENRKYTTKALPQSKRSLNLPEDNGILPHTEIFVEPQKTAAWNA